MKTAVKPAVTSSAAGSSANSSRVLALMRATPCAHGNRKRLLSCD
jgi:hypothetical protein